jgi:hypothetical protein
MVLFIASNRKKLIGGLMKKTKIHLIKLVFILLFGLGINVIHAQKNTPSSLGKLIFKAEQIIFGMSPPASLLQRFKKVEYAIFGRNFSQKTFLERAKKIRQVLLDGDYSNPSLVLKANFIEWAVFATITQSPLITKVSRVEKSFLGKTFPGKSLLYRINRLVKIISPEGNISFKTIVLPEGTLLEVKLLKELSSKKSKSKERFGFLVNSNLIIDNVLLVPAGSYGVGIVNRVKKSGWFGKNGKLYLNFKFIYSLDGTKIPLTIDKQAYLSNKKLGLSITASLLGVAAFGPVGILSGFFIKGKDISLHENQIIYVSTKEPLSLKGIKVKNIEVQR